MPVDIAAAEVLALKDSGGRVFHIMNPDPPTAETAAKAVDEGTYVVPDEVFTQMLSETAKGPYAGAPFAPHRLLAPGKGGNAGDRRDLRRDAARP